MEAVFSIVNMGRMPGIKNQVVAGPVVVLVLGVLVMLHVQPELAKLSVPAPLPL